MISLAPINPLSGNKMSFAYYNEIDPYAAQWLRNLIAGGHIAQGEVDTRSITDVKAEDLAGFTQCHFFAGIGGWSLALRLAGWPDERAVWTGSCPCQPFSTAGKAAGTNDERHLWPVWFDLIRECKPRVVFGEQVEAAINHGWLDLVQDDLEGEGYAFGSVGLPAACVGSPHIRQRLWFVADANISTCWQQRGLGVQRRWSEDTQQTGVGCSVGKLADANSNGCHQIAIRKLHDAEHHTEPCGGTCGLGDTYNERLEGFSGYGNDREGRQKQVGSATEASAVAGFWRDAIWLPCKDGKSRPVKPSIQPLAHGLPGRVGQLRAYGNAIVPQVGAEVVRAYMECRP